MGLTISAITAFLSIWYLITVEAIPVTCVYALWRLGSPRDWLMKSILHTPRVIVSPNVVVGSTRYAIRPNSFDAEYGWTKESPSYIAKMIQAFIQLSYIRF